MNTTTRVLACAAVVMVAILAVAMTAPSAQAQNSPLTSEQELGHQQGIPYLTPQEELGKNLFYDTKLSTPRGQACAGPPRSNSRLHRTR